MTLALVGIVAVAAAVVLLTATVAMFASEPGHGAASNVAASPRKSRSQGRVVTARQREVETKRLQRRREAERLAKYSSGIKAPAAAAYAPAAPGVRGFQPGVAARAAAKGAVEMAAVPQLGRGRPNPLTSAKAQDRLEELREMQRKANSKLAKVQGQGKGAVPPKQRGKSDEIAMPERLWLVKGSELTISPSPISITPEVQAKLLEWGSADPQPDGKVLPTFTFGAAKSGTTALYHAVVDDAHHLMPWVAPGVVSGRPLRIKELGSQLILRNRMPYWQELAPFDSPNEILDQASRDGIERYCGGAESNTCGKPPAEIRLPVLVYDGSVFVHNPAYIRGLHDCFEHVLDRIRYTMTMKDPVKRAESAFWHKVDDMTDEDKARIDINKALSAGVALTEKCRNECMPRDPENWYVCCWVYNEDLPKDMKMSLVARNRKKGSKALSPKDNAMLQGVLEAQVNWCIAPGFYAEHLRYAYCVLVLEPLGVSCPSWDDPAIDGLLDYSKQHRFLVVNGDEVKADSPAVVERVMHHIGAPNDRIPAEVLHASLEAKGAKAEKAKAQMGAGGEAPAHTNNDHPHLQEMNPMTLAKLAALYSEDDQRLRRLLGHELPWDLSSYLPKRQRGL